MLQGHLTGVDTDLFSLCFSLSCSCSFSLSGSVSCSGSWAGMVAGLPAGLSDKGGKPEKGQDNQTKKTILC